MHRIKVDTLYLLPSGKWSKKKPKSIDHGYGILTVTEVKDGKIVSLTLTSNLVHYDERPKNKFEFR